MKALLPCAAAMLCFGLAVAEPPTPPTDGECCDCVSTFGGTDGDSAYVVQVCYYPLPSGPQPHTKVAGLNSEQCVEGMNVLGLKKSVIIKGWRLGDGTYVWFPSTPITIMRKPPTVKQCDDGCAGAGEWSLYSVQGCIAGME